MSIYDIYGISYIIKKVKYAKSIIYIKIFVIAIYSSPTCCAIVFMYLNSTCILATYDFPLFLIYIWNVFSLIFVQNG